ncbi:HD domain-containing phosphohydrolase [Oryzomicrobium sp.]|uniref:HD-GYP domain-containing protein n=1 Tax=Oryzomicrobium sp. TaxID=1911578 RepID=UPI0025F192DD|nr:HD domain-containing phosphohydrolase [Oryzomicrobium sp.]MCE1243076.1 HD domain-containing protein [Oryzomicrobium sp.]
MSTKPRQAVAADFVLHQPLGWPLYDANGLLLLKQGYVITMPSLIDRLLERGCYIGPPNTEQKRIQIDAGGDEGEQKEGGDDTAAPRKAAQAPVFFRTLDLITSIRRIHKLLCDPPALGVNIRGYVEERADQLIAMVGEDADAVLAAAYLTTEIPEYRPGHQLLGAAIAALLAPSCGINGAQRRTLVCAALTRDVGLHEFDQSPDGTSRTLSETARAKVQGHAELSAGILATHGIKDEPWLRYVREHHERPDGSGYPVHKRTGEALPGSFLLNLADSYASMVLTSERVPGKFPANVIRELFLEKGHRYDELHVTALFKTLTRFPAGTLVSLANGEICMVKRTAADGKPMAYSIYDRTGMPQSSPVLRDTGQPEFAITGCVSPAKCQSAALIIRRLWQAAR